MRQLRGGPEHRRLADAVAEVIESGGTVSCLRWPEAFFSDDLADRDEAAVLCAGCPVFALCDAAGQLEEHGLWAGRNRETRRHPRRRREAA